MNSSPRLRFDPSPTGPLHIGGARTALFNYLLAKQGGGSLILRLDDTDRERSRPEFEKDIIESLHWLGLSWDEGPDKRQVGDSGPFRQSERLESHIQAAARLLSGNKAYQGKEGVIRLRYPECGIVVSDAVCGDCVFQPAALGSEPVLVRSDGSPTYHLASVVDDIEMGITHIVRGQDHLTNSAKHVLLFEALESKVPQFAHLPLILGEDGVKMSKRSSEGLVGVGEFKAAGYLPEALLNYLLLLGWSHPEGKEQLTLSEAVEVFSLERVNKTGVKFENSKMRWLNAFWLKNLPPERAAEQALVFAGDYDEAIISRGQVYWRGAVEKLRTEVTLLSEFKELAEMLFSLNINFSPEVKENYATEAAKHELLEISALWRSLVHDTELEEGQDCFTAAQFNKMVKLIRKQLPYEAKAVFHALRAGLTGKLSGPELKTLVPLVTRDVLCERADSALVSAQKLE